MAAETFDVIWDIQHGGPGYEGVKAGEKFKKGETKPATEPATGLRAKVYSCKYTQIVAESAEEACKVVQEAYGTRAGVCGVPEAAKVLEFKTV